MIIIVVIVVVISFAKPDDPPVVPTPVPTRSMGADIVPPLPEGDEPPHPSLESTKEPPENGLRIRLRNNGSWPVWPGVIGNIPFYFENATWKLEPENYFDIIVDPEWSGRVWPRYGCNFKGHCQTGQATLDRGAGNVDYFITSGQRPTEIFEATFTREIVDGIEKPSYMDLSGLDGTTVGKRFEMIIHGGKADPGTEPKFTAGPGFESPYLTGTPFESCPGELRVFADRKCMIDSAGDNSMCGFRGQNIDSSQHFLNQDTEEAYKEYVGCRSICSSYSDGWAGIYTEERNVSKKGKGYEVWLDKVTDNKGKCHDYGDFDQNQKFGHCRDVVARSRRDTDDFTKAGTETALMKDLVCCKGVETVIGHMPSGLPIHAQPPFGFSPYQDCDAIKGNITDDGKRKYRECLDNQAFVCPNLTMTKRPDYDYKKRASDEDPNWLLSTEETDYTTLYESRNSYTWQFNDSSSTYKFIVTDNTMIELIFSDHHY